MTTEPPLYLGGIATAVLVVGAWIAGVWAIVTLGEVAVVSDDPDPWRVPIEDIPDGWRVSHCIMQPGNNHWWAMLEGPEKSWPIRTAGAWGMTLREAVLNACGEALL